MKLLKRYFEDIYCLSECSNGYSESDDIKFKHRIKIPKESSIINPTFFLSDFFCIEKRLYIENVEYFIVNIIKENVQFDDNKNSEIVNQEKRKGENNKKIVKGRGIFTFDNNFDNLNQKFENLTLYKNEKSYTYLSTKNEKSSYLCSDELHKNFKIPNKNNRENKSTNKSSENYYSIKSYSNNKSNYTKNYYGQIKTIETDCDLIFKSVISNEFTRRKENFSFDYGHILEVYNCLVEEEKLKLLLKKYTSDNNIDDELILRKSRSQTFYIICNSKLNAEKIMTVICDEFCLRRFREEK